MYADNAFFQLFTFLKDVFFYVGKAFSPLILGIIFAYLLNDPVEWIHKKLNKHSNTSCIFQHSKGRGISILITYLLFFLIVFSITFSFVYLIIGALPSGGIVKTAQQIYQYFSSYLNSDIFDIKATTADWMERYFSLGAIINFISNASGIIINTFLGIVCSIYLLKDKDFFLLLWQKFLSLVFKQKIHGIINEVLYEINSVLSTFIRGAAIDSVLIALLSSVVLTILNVNFAVIIGIISGVLNVIPYFGPFLGMVPAFLVTATTQGIGKSIITVLSLFLIQQLDSNYIYPKVVGASTGLHPLYILASVSIMGYFGGVFGMLLAVPIASIIQVIFKKWFYYL